MCLSPEEEDIQIFHLVQQLLLHYQVSWALVRQVGEQDASAEVHQDNDQVAKCELLDQIGLSSSL